MDNAIDPRSPYAGRSDMALVPAVFHAFLGYFERRLPDGQGLSVWLITDWSIAHAAVTNGGLRQMTHMTGADSPSLATMGLNLQALDRAVALPPHHSENWEVIVAHEVSDMRSAVDFITAPRRDAPDGVEFGTLYLTGCLQRIRDLVGRGMVRDLGPDLRAGVEADVAHVEEYLGHVIRARIARAEFIDARGADAVPLRVCKFDVNRASKLALELTPPNRHPVTVERIRRKAFDCGCLPLANEGAYAGPWYSGLNVVGAQGWSTLLRQQSRRCGSFVVHVGGGAWAGHMIGQRALDDARGRFNALLGWRIIDEDERRRSAQIAQVLCFGPFEDDVVVDAGGVPDRDTMPSASAILRAVRVAFPADWFGDFQYDGVAGERAYEKRVKQTFDCETGRRSADARVFRRAPPPPGRATASRGDARFGLALRWHDHPAHRAMFRGRCDLCALNVA